MFLGENFAQNRKVLRRIAQKNERGAVKSRFCSADHSAILTFGYIHILIYAYILIIELPFNTTSVVLNTNSLRTIEKFSADFLFLARVTPCCMIFGKHKWDKKRIVNILRTMVV